MGDDEADPLPPLQRRTWFSFGFVFFLQSCIEGSGNGTFRIPSGSGSSSHGRHGGDTGNHVGGIVHDVAHALRSAISGSGPNPELPETGVLVAIVAICVVIAIPLVILVYWLGTRGQMMPSAASRPDGPTSVRSGPRPPMRGASKLFKFHLVIGLVSAVIFLPLAGAGVVLALPTIREGVPIENVLPALIGLGVVALLLLFPFMLIGAMARNFVAPLMLKHGLTAREGWKRFWAVGKDHVGGIVVFYLLRIAVSIGAGIVGVIASFVTCCLGFLPVLHQTLMAPYYVFERAWTLEVLASMSPDFDLRGAPSAPPPAYDFGPGAPPNPYGGQPGNNPYAPPGYGGGSGGPPPGGFGGPPPGGFGAP